MLFEIPNAFAAWLIDMVKHEGSLSISAIVGLGFVVVCGAVCVAMTAKVIPSPNKSEGY